MMFIMVLALLLSSGFVSDADDVSIYPDGEYEAIYLGVYNYGKEGIDKEHKNDFYYRFNIDGSEVRFKMNNGTLNDKGEYDYPLQNRLKEGYRFMITIEDSVVVNAIEITSDDTSYTPIVKGKAGTRTVKNFLLTALEPVGTALYIYGGGWDWQDVGSAIQTRTIGVPIDWVKFFNSQDKNFTYKSKDGNEAYKDPEHSYYPYGEYNEYYYAGPDCSGYIGWTLYNTFNTVDGLDGYVISARNIAKDLSEKGYGGFTKDFISDEGRVDLQAGDIVSISDHHVWISLGTCEDGSVVIAHCSPSKSRTGQPGGGIQISAIGDSTDCEAYQLADKYMSKYYPLWYERYPIYLTDANVYFNVEKGNAGRFRWSENGLTDPDNISNMTPANVLKELFSENEASTDDSKTINEEVKTVKVPKAPKTGDSCF